MAAGFSTVIVQRDGAGTLTCDFCGESAHVTWAAVEPTAEDLMSAHFRACPSRGAGADQAEVHVVASDGTTKPIVVAFVQPRRP